MVRCEPKRLAWAGRGVAVALMVMAVGRVGWGQEKPEDVRIVMPVVDKTAGTVTLPGAFWNEHVAEWVEVALSGRPSDFLHETVLSVTTTRALLEQALREIGCRDGDTWAEGVKEFVRIRGDRIMVLVTVERGGKKETYSLDELVSFSRWGVSMGPYGFMFKGDPDRDKPKAAVAPIGGAEGAGGAVGDGTKILRDDPQMALVFKGLQNRSQSFADHPLAYVEDRWEWEEIHRGRNHAVLGAEVFDGKVPVTLVFKRVTEEQLLVESGKVWHDDGFKAYMLKQMETAKEIDKNKAAYLALRKSGVEPSESAPFGLKGDMAVAAAEIERGYATLDAAWSRWAAEHLKPETSDESSAVLIKGQAARWAEFMALNQERAEQLAVALAASQVAATIGVGNPGRMDVQMQAQYSAAVGGRLVARSRALIAENKMSGDYWQQQWEKVRAGGEPKADDVWAQSIKLHLAVQEARLKVGAAGVAYGTAQLANPRDAAKEAELKQAMETSVKAMAVAEARLALVNVEFEISKRVDVASDPELPALGKQREELLGKIKELTQN